MSKFWDWLTNKKPEVETPREGYHAPLSGTFGWAPEDYNPGPTDVESPYKSKTVFHRGYILAEPMTEAQRASLRAVDTHTEVTYAYCQAGHLHQYNNDELVMNQALFGPKSKHFPLGSPPRPGPARVGGFGWKDKTIKETPYCD